MKTTEHRKPNKFLYLWPDMIDFEKHILDNGLRVLFHQDKSSPLVVVNVLYDVGSRDEDPERTGFAHLFEHLMFGGSVNIPDFDGPIQSAGGDNNAFTNCDVTNFYNLLPYQNIETALWLESDRMMQLNFNQEMLDVQKKVVVEEFKETCINVPYGDMWHELSKLCYKDHPYQWPTIGKTFDHIEKAQLSDVEQFFNRHYNPNNAILCVSGNFESAQTLELVKKWFGPIPPGPKRVRSLNEEKKQTQSRKLIKEAHVPGKNFIVAWHMVSRSDPDYYTFDLISDLLSTGKSARLTQRLLKNSNLYSGLSAYISGTMDPGLFIVDAKLSDEAKTDESIEKVMDQIQELKDNRVGDEELTKVKNKVISLLTFSELSILNKAINLCHFELMGDADLINGQAAKYEEIKAEDIQRVAQSYLRNDNNNTLIYLPHES